MLLVEKCREFVAQMGCERMLEKELRSNSW